MVEKSLVEEMSHRLSVSGRVFAFNCHRTPVKNATLKSDWTLVFSRHSFDREKNAFLKVSDGTAVIGRGTSSHPDVIACKCVLNAQRRTAAPCVLVSQKRKNGESFRYCLLTLSSSNLLEPCIEFKLSQMAEDVFILRGPTVLWRHAGGVFYKSLHTAEVRQIPIQMSHIVVGELPHLKEQVFVLGLQNLSDNQCPSQTVGCFVESGQVFDGSAILPHPYICITRCILVLSAEKGDGEGLPKCAVVAATSHQQLVWFENGAVKDTCHLPFDEPESIQVVDTGRHGCLFVVSFHGGQVCAIWRESFKLASQWSDVGSVHVDDFLGCGSDQMLLVFKDHGTMKQPLERFLLTDLCGISYARCEEDNEVPSDPPQENYLLTLQALESRLQSGLSVLQDLQREVRVKKRVLQHSVQTLVDVVSGRDPSLSQPEQEGLVALWDGADESKEDTSDDKTRDMPAASSKPLIDKLWHRVADDQMVIGVILTADNTVPLASVSLSILTETGQSSTPAVIQTQSQVFWLPAPCSSSSSSSSSTSTSSPSAFTFPEPAAKRSKQHNDLNTCRLAVTAVTGLTPLLNSGCVKCSVTLHYIQKQDAFAPVSSSIMSVLHCGEIILDIHGDHQTRLLKNPELATDEATEDLLSLMTVLDHWVFHINSPGYSLGNVEGWICKRAGCKKIGVSCHYLLDSSGPSALMLLHWDQITAFQGELSIHSSHLQMLQFLDSFLSFLPVSCSVRLVNCKRGQGAAQIFSLALEKEVLSLRDTMSSLLCEGEKEAEKRKTPGHEETPGRTAVEDLQRCREGWQLDVERSKMRLSPLVDVGGYRRLTRSVLDVQLEGDLAALLHTQRILLS